MIILTTYNNNIAKVPQIITELKIDKLAGLGDGVGINDGKKIFVPYTAAGDIIRARITKETAEATYAEIEEILTPGKDRIAPVCKHFGTCGGCTLQHINRNIYNDFKYKTAQEAVRKAGFDENCVDNLITLPANTRRRVDLKISSGKLGFYEGGSHKIVDIEECEVLEPELLELVMQIKRQVTNLKDITAIQINGVDGGYDVVIEGNSILPEKLKSIKRLSVRNKGKLKTIYQQGQVTISLDDIVVDVPSGAFLQASRMSQDIMTRLVKSAVTGSANVLDLFSGIGTYSFPISSFAKVTAIEGEKLMADAMNNAAKKYNISNKFKAVKRDLFINPLTKGELSGYDAVIINPPRTGAKAQTLELAKTAISKIIMVSCNPATFTRDARILKEGGYKLQKVTPIDQFVYNAHLELVAEFTCYSNSN